MGVNGQRRPFDRAVCGLGINALGWKFAYVRCMNIGLINLPSYLLDHLKAVNSKLKWCLKLIPLIIAHREMAIDMANALHARQRAPFPENLSPS